MVLPDIHEINRPVRLFYSYSHKDEDYRVEFENQLRSLRNQGWVEDWHDRMLVPGQNWEREIDKRLFSSDLILLLISVNFISSDYCWQVEMEQALELHERGLATVIPVMVHPCEMRSTPFRRIQGLPPGLRPISTWENQDSAWAEVAKGICDVISQMLSDGGSVEKQKGHQGRGVRGTVRVEISIDRDFDEFSTEDKRRIQKGLAEFLRLDHNVEIIMTRRGSVKIVVKLHSDEAEKLELAFGCGLLESYGIVGVRNLGPASKSSSILGRVVSWGNSIKERTSDWANNSFGQVPFPVFKPLFLRRVALSTVLISVVGIGVAIVQENKNANDSSAPDVEFIWTEPTTGTPVDHYVAQILVNDTDTLFIYPVPTNSVVLQFDYGNRYQVRVAGVDANDSQGPMSLWSLPYTPELGPPGIGLILSPRISRD